MILNNVTKPLTLSEIALVCSHRNLMNHIVHDNTVLDSDWTLIMGMNIHIHQLFAYLI